jgi:hypothetical protein
MTRRLARPYAVVGGRTTPALPDLRVESQIVRTPRGLRSLPSALFERREILLLCSEPVSVAELAVHLQVPLGVARVIVADAAADGGVRVDLPDDAPLSVELLQRVLDGLRAL